jgi:hypothetical protein
MLGLFRPVPKPSRRGQLTVESLEDRSVPAVFTVTNLSDHNPGSLRQVIANANARLGEDTVRFAPQLQGTIALTTGEIDITDDVRIEGPGANRITVSGTRNSRIFDLDDALGPINVYVSGLKLTRGLADDLVNGNDGGANRAADSDLTLRNCVVSGNRATDNGGAVAAGGGAVTAVNTIFANNSTTLYDGGALFLPDTRFRAINCRILNNSAGTNTVNYGDGGGFYGAGSATIRNCTISGNTSDGEGGGLEWSGGSITIERTTVRNNTSLYGGGIAVDGGRLTLRDSTVAFNRTNGDANQGGAGLELDGIEALIINSTISGNVDQTTNPDDDTGGGGIKIEGGRTVIRNSTIAFNSTTGQGGGIFVDEGGRLQMASTIVSNSRAPAGNFDVARGSSQDRVTVVFSLIQRIQPGFINVLSQGNQVGVNPRLLPLANNGGPTQTHLFTVGSPARDAGSNPDALPFDQRGPGFPRVKDGRIDIGAVEL